MQVGELEIIEFNEAPPPYEDCITMGGPGQQPIIRDSTPSVYCAMIAPIRERISDVIFPIRFLSCLPLDRFNGIPLLALMVVR